MKRALTREKLRDLYGTLAVSGSSPRTVRSEPSGLSPTTVRLVHKVLRRALADAVEDGLLRANPATKLKTANPATVERPVWGAEQVRVFLAGQNDRLRALWVLAFTTGMRRGELAGLRWVDVDLDGAVVSVRRNRVAVGHAVADGEPKSGRARTVELDPSTVTELRAHRRRQLEERLAWAEAWSDCGLVFAFVIAAGFGFEDREGRRAVFPSRR